jgi:hypothetical protein
MLAVVIPLALVAALFYAVSDFLEQRAAQRSAAGAGLGVLDADGAQPSRGAQLLAAAKSAGWTLRRLVRDRVWFAGWAVGTLAYFVQATALNLGSVSVATSGSASGTGSAPAWSASAWCCSCCPAAARRAPTRYAGAG